jgi:hypothetical protein
MHSIKRRLGSEQGLGALVGPGCDGMNPGELHFTFPTSLYHRKLSEVRSDTVRFDLKVTLVGRIMSQMRFFKTMLKTSPPILSLLSRA